MATSFVLRVDAGPQVGYGHAGRCLALWEHLRDRCAIAVADPAAAEFVRRHGARLAAPADHADVTVIDRAPAASVAEVRDASATVVCLLDDAGPARELADAVIDPPTGPAWPPATGTRLGGFEHALIRADIRAARTDPLPGIGVLVSLGGSDPTGLTAPLCAALGRAGVATTAVLGPGYHGPGTNGGDVLGDPALWPLALAGAGLLVTGFGHTLLEAAHLGVPALAVPRDEREAREAAAFAVHETMEPASADDIVAAVGALHGSDRAREMRRAGPALVDGRGAERVARALQELR